MNYVKNLIFMLNYLVNRSATKNTVGTMLFLFILFFLTLLSYARDVSFSWTANTEPVDGYKLHYVKVTDNNTPPPYDGTGALEGDSPVSVGNVTSFTLHGLSDDEDYYFALTAFKGTAESDYVALAPRIKSIRQIIR